MVKPENINKMCEWNVSETGQVSLCDPNKYAYYKHMDFNGQMNWKHQFNMKSMTLQMQNRK